MCAKMKVLPIISLSFKSNIDLPLNLYIKLICLTALLHKLSSFWAIVTPSNYTSICLIIIVPWISIESGLISLFVYFVMNINLNFIGIGLHKIVCKT